MAARIATRSFDPCACRNRICHRHAAALGTNPVVVKCLLQIAAIKLGLADKAVQTLPSFVFIVRN
jgi:hypothetical protein